MNGGGEGRWDDDDAVTVPLPVLATLPGLIEDSVPTRVPVWREPVAAPAGLQPVRTGDRPTTAVRPAGSSDGSGGPFVVRPRPSYRRDRDKSRLVMLGVTGAAAGGLVALVMSVTGGGDEPAASAPTKSASPPISATTQQPATSPPDPAQQARLTAMLPPDFTAPGICRPSTLDRPAAVTARLVCTAVAPPAGSPVSGIYNLVAAPPGVEIARGLERLLTASMADSSVVICPGGQRGFQSPGSWHRTATPTKPSGTMYCGVRRDGVAILGWTDTDRSLFIEIFSRPGLSGFDRDAALGGMYQWWSQNS